MKKQMKFMGENKEKTIPYFSWYPSRIMVRVFANSLGDWGSISGWVIPKTQKMLLDAALLKIQFHKVWIKSNGSNPGKGVAPSPTLGVAAIEISLCLNNGRSTYYIYPKL